MLAQLNMVFTKMDEALVLMLYLNDKPVSLELKNYMEELSSLTDKLSLVMVTDDHLKEVAED